MHDKMSCQCKCHGKTGRCDDTVYRSFSRSLVTFFKLFCSNSPAGHNCICLSKSSSHTIREICNLYSIWACCNIHSIHIHLIHKTHNKGHCDVVKCCFKRRRKTNLNNLRKYLSWCNSLRTLFCFYKHSPHTCYNNKIYNSWNNRGNSNSHYTPVEYK